MARAALRSAGLGASRAQHIFSSILAQFLQEWHKLCQSSLALFASKITHPHFLLASQLAGGILLSAPLMLASSSQSLLGGMPPSFGSAPAPLGKSAAKPALGPPALEGMLFLGEREAVRCSFKKASSAWLRWQSASAR